MDSITTPQIPKFTTIEKVGGILCHLCNIVHSDKKQFESHYKAVHNKNNDHPTVYTCVVCQKQFLEYANLRAHCYDNHFAFRCDPCNRTFKKKVMLKDHVNRCHTHKCSTCDKQFSTEIEYHLHKITHKEQLSSTECKICKETISTIETCNQHIKKHFKFTYTCPICNEEIEKDNASQHLSIHFGNEATAHLDNDGDKLSESSTIEAVGGALCDICNRTFNDKDEFDFHYLTFHQRTEIFYSCNICAKQYHNFRLLMGHCYNDHVARRVFTCDACEETFPRLSRLLLHKEEHSGGEKKHACPLCHLRFSSELRLRTHRAVAHWEPANAINCSIDDCGHVYESKKDLIAHQRMHSFNPDNWCRQCGVQFTSAFDCEIHLDVHKTKTYQCPMCAKVYRDEYHTTNHVTKHFITSHHICKICGKSYTAARRLVQHMKVHSVTKNYKCKVCDKSFAKKYQIDQHLVLHLSIKPYKCTVCSKTLSSFANWKKHLKKMHKICHKDAEKPDIQWESVDLTNIYQVNNNDLIIAPKSNGAKDSVTKDQQMKYAEPVRPLDAKVCPTNPSKQISVEFLPKEPIKERPTVDLNGKSERSMSNPDEVMSMQLSREQLELQLDEDKVEFTNVLLELNTLGTDPSSEDTVATVATETSCNQIYPCEYGPDFIDTCFNYSGHSIGVDDHVMLPHIDPLLTVVNQKMMPQFDHQQGPSSIDYIPGNTFDHMNHGTPIKDCLFAYPINRMIMNTN